MRNMILGAMAVMASAISSQASAAIISLDFDLVASGFGAGAPINPVVGNFQITFDNSATIFDATSGIVVTGFNLPFDSRYAYNATTDKLFVGTLPDPGDAPVFGGGGYGFSVLNASGTYSGGFFRYGLPPAGLAPRADIYTATETTLTPAAAAVPEPASWALMIGGFGLTGAAIRGRRRASVSLERDSL